jgi:hypothetical protein
LTFNRKNGVQLSSNEPNPPAEPSPARSKIDGDLVQINLGIDRDENHTLEVYRLQPEAKYLGMIRIIDVKNQTAVGRIVMTGNPPFGQS